MISHHLCNLLNLFSGMQQKIFCFGKPGRGDILLKTVSGKTRKLVAKMKFIHIEAGCDGVEAKIL